MLMFMGCGKKNKNPVENVKQALADTDLQKDFQSECTTKVGAMALTGVATTGKASVKTMRKEYRFSGANVTRRLVYFTGANCENEAFTFEENGDFKTNKDQKTSDGAYHIDMHFDRVSAKATSQEGAMIANALGVCDKSDWSVGDKVNVTDQSPQLNCYGASEPRDVANIYRVDNGKLTMGDSNSEAIAPEARPKVLENTTFSQK
jgi:hypothetical protein